MYHTCYIRMNLSYLVQKMSFVYKCSPDNLARLVVTVGVLFFFVVVFTPTWNLVLHLLHHWLRRFSRWSFMPCQNEMTTLLKKQEVLSVSGRDFMVMIASRLFFSVEIRACSETTALSVSISSFLWCYQHLDVLVVHFYLNIFTVTSPAWSCSEKLKYHYFSSVTF